MTAWALIVGGGLMLVSQVPTTTPWQGGIALGMVALLVGFWLRSDRVEGE